MACNSIAAVSAANAVPSSITTLAPGLNRRQANIMSSEIAQIPASVTRSDVQRRVAVLQDRLGGERLQDRARTGCGRSER